MELKTKYITSDDYFRYFGENLQKFFDENSDNPSDAVNSFLIRIENRMETFLNAKCFKNIGSIYCHFSDFQKEHYKRALLEQAYYVIHNGDLSVDSGYDPTKGEIASVNDISSRTISQNAINELKVCGLWTRKITGQSWLYPFMW